MKRWLTLLAVTVILCAVLPTTAHAQIGLGLGRPVTNPLGTPVVSPYLNLLRGGNPAINYYGIVRPLENLENFEQAALTQPAVDPNRPANVSGYNTRFMSYGGYFGTIRPAPAPRPGTGGLPAGSVTPLIRPGSQPGIR
jgi:hypothetical protein